MNPDSLFRQTCTVYTKSSYNEEGREVVGSGTSVICRAQESTKRRLLPNGNLIEINLILYVPSDTSIDTDYKVTYDSKNYKVYSIYKGIDGAGQVNHIKLECTKWQTT